MLEMRKMNNNL